MNKFHPRFGRVVDIQQELFQAGDPDSREGEVECAI